MQLSEALFSKSGQGEDCRKENTRTWLCCGRYMLNRKSASFSSMKVLRGLEKMKMKIC